MPLDYDYVMSLANLGQEYGYSDREVMLYACGIGLGTDPLNERELSFVNEAYLSGGSLKVVPTFASVAAWGIYPGDMRVNRVKVVDGGREIFFHRPMPVAAAITADSTVLGVYDKGADKGAIIRHQAVLKDQAGEPLATMVSTRFARGDGGFGGSSAGLPEAHSVPSRSPDMTVDIPTSPNQALLYRLSGDRNPLHSDPAFAARAGFPRPILHGLCTYGMACRAILQSYADYDPTAFKYHAARFSAPVYPGETVSFDLWRDGQIISFVARVAARDATVLKNGKTLLA